MARERVERFLKNLASALGYCIAEDIEVLDAAIPALIGVGVFWFVWMAVRLNCDFVRTIGFLGASCIPIFMLSAVTYIALYGLSILLEGLDYHRTHCDDSKHWAGMADFMR